MKMGKEFKISFVLVSVCYLVLGLVLLFYPSFSQRMLCYALGGISVGVDRDGAFAEYVCIG